MLTYYDDQNHKVGETVDVPHMQMSSRFVALNCNEWKAKYALYISKDGIEFHLYRIEYDVNGFRVSHVA